MPLNTPAVETPALIASKVTKSYGNLHVLDGIDLNVANGAAFGLVGLNGAGKTTLIKCLLDFCAVDGGNLAIFGVPHRRTVARARVAFVPERFVPPHYLTCLEFIQLTTRLTGSPFDRGRVDSICDELGLDLAALGRPVRQLSKGMTQKLGLAGCLTVERDLYVLDEPMSGLDPASRVAVKSVLSRLTREGRTLFFTSHVLGDVEELCTSIAVLHGGEIRFAGSPRRMCDEFGEPGLERAFMRCIDAASPTVAA